MIMDSHKKVETPPIDTLYLPLNFWLSIIAILDKKVELALLGSGHGIITMTIKMHKNKIHEVSFGEEMRIREIVEKAGDKGLKRK